MLSGVSRVAPVELLADFAAVVRGRGLRWYVFGAQAVVLYGRPRMTADVDVTVEVPPGELGGLLDELQRAGFAPRFTGPDAVALDARVVPLVHERTGLPLDLVLAGPGLEEEFLDRAHELDVGGVTVPVITAEDLVALKILAHRPKDLEDARGILEERGAALDLPRVREVLSLLEAALGQGDLLPTLDQLLGATESPRPRPRGGGAKKRPRKRR